MKLVVIARNIVVIILSPMERAKLVSVAVIRKIRKSQEERTNERINTKEKGED